MKKALKGGDCNEMVDMWHPVKLTDDEIYFKLRFEMNKTGNFSPLLPLIAT